MLSTPDQIAATIQQLLPKAQLAVEGSALLVPSEHLIAVCRLLKDRAEFNMDYVANLTAVDYPPERIEVVYHLYSMAAKHGPIALKVKLPRATPVVASVTPVWRGAEYQEREVYDLFGVKFEGHPDLRRILMWEGFDGHPMRKDYKVEDQDALEEPAR
jgi:NADH/F420H2 dehydrogenase subunit C